jgi:hypothetical protein
MNSTLLLALALIAGGCSLPIARAAETPAADAYTWVNLSSCKMPLLAPPRLPERSDLVYNVERRLLDLDGNGQCVVMDVWLERLGSVPDSMSRNFEHRFYRCSRGRWVDFISPELSYYPYALRAPSGQTLYVVAPLDADVGDSIVLAGVMPTLYQPASERQGLFAGDGQLTPYPGDPRPALRALAAALSARLHSGELLKEELSNVAPSLRAHVEKERIAMILKAADATATSTK